SLSLPVQATTRACNDRRQILPHQTLDALCSRQARHLIEQPILGCCSAGPLPVVAMSFIPSYSSRGAPAGRRGATASIEGSPVLEQACGVEAVEIRRAHCAVSARDGLALVVQVGERKI